MLSPKLTTQIEIRTIQAPQNASLRSVKHTQRSAYQPNVTLTIAMFYESTDIIPKATPITHPSVAHILRRGL